MPDKKQNPKEEDVVFEPTEEETGDENLRQKIKTLREKLELSQKERAEYLAGWQRAKADYINLEKKLSSGHSNAVSLGSERLFADILPALDSFELAMGNKKAWESVPENWRVGMEYIWGQIKSALANNGFAEICPKTGDKVNFEHHLIVETAETEDGKKDGTIEKVLQKGYLQKDRVVRPAKVSAFVYKI